MENNKTITGIIAAPLTGFKPDGTVDYDIIPQYASFLQDNGIAGVFINGTTGEGFSLTLEERKRATEKWMAAASNSFKIIAHVTCGSVEESKQCAVHAQQVGVDAIGIVAPIFFKPDSVETLVSYVAAIAEQAAQTPCYYYHLPSMTGVDFPGIKFLEAAHGKFANLAGIKYTHGDLMDADACRQFAGGTYNIMHGQDETLVLGLGLGATAAVGSTYNFMAPLYIRLVDAVKAGELAKAHELQRRACAIIQCMYATGSFLAACKAAMRWQGVELNGMRLPLIDLSSETEQQMRKQLTALGFFEIRNGSAV